MMKVLIPVILIFLQWGCSNKGNTQPDILNKDKMAAVLWDIMRANSFTELYIKKDSLKNATLENMKLQQQIFTIHNVSKEAFYKSYNYYSLQPDQMRVILDSIAARSERNRIQVYQQPPAPILK
jgi:hypothetical protein